VTARGGRVAAAIDVGSNSVLLLTVSLEPDGRARAVDEAVATTRLGSGLAPSGTLDRDASGSNAASGRLRRRRARAAGRVRLGFATGAAGVPPTARVRDGDRHRASVPVEILSGEREAALAYAAAVHGLGLAGDAVLAIDVGGPRRS
jgi:exopolyphosphatase/pppGpp-phosphohydrolase